MSEATLIDGKAVAARITDALSVKAAAFTQRVGAPPGLAVVLIGDDPASGVYVRMKGRMAARLGYHSVQKSSPAETSEAELAQIVQDLNADPSIHGILVQLPLPPHIDARKIISLIDPSKDVDGFHPMNVGLLTNGDADKAFVPCTPAGSILLAREARGDLTGLHALVIGRSNIVGRPASQLFLQADCTVTIAHSRSRDLPDLARTADILVAAVGRPGMVRADWIKPGATVIDVGVNRVPAPEKGDGETKLVGDVDFDAARRVAGAITPVPGGVGPMTIAMLMANTLTAARRLNGEPDAQPL